MQGMSNEKQKTLVVEKDQEKIVDEVLQGFFGLLLKIDKRVNKKRYEVNKGTVQDYGK